MKILTLLLSLSSTYAFAQQVVVANLKENIVYCGVDNPLSALVAGYPCSSVVLTVDNGTITKASCGQFLYIPAEVGNIKIKVWVKKGEQFKKVGEMPYRAKRLPEPNAMIGISIGGKISLKMLIAMGGVRAVLLNSNFDVSFSIKSYHLMASRDKETLFSAENTGAQYSDATLSYFKDLKEGDQLLISNITCIGPDGKEWTLQPLEFTITE